jgi:hypothetical protein
MVRIRTIHQYQVDAYSTDSLIQALGERRRFLGEQKATLLWGGLPAHRSKAMRTWLRRGRYSLGRPSVSTPQRHARLVDPLTNRRSGWSRERDAPNELGVKPFNADLEDVLLGVDGTRSHQPEVARCQVEHILDFLDRRCGKLRQAGCSIQLCCHTGDLTTASLGLDVQIDAALGVVELGVGLIALSSPLQDEISAEGAVPRER